MDDMKEFLTSCGLGNAIPVFESMVFTFASSKNLNGWKCVFFCTLGHELSVDQLEELSKNDMKELLPALGPRLKLVKAIKQRTLQNERLMKSRPKSKMKMSERKKMKKNDPEKNAFVLRMLKDVRWPWFFRDSFLKIFFIKETTLGRPVPGGRGSSS